MFSQSWSLWSYIYIHIALLKKERRKRGQWLMIKAIKSPWSSPSYCSIHSHLFVKHPSSCTNGNIHPYFKIRTFPKSIAVTPNSCHYFGIKLQVQYGVVSWAAAIVAITKPLRVNTFIIQHWFVQTSQWCFFINNRIKMNEWMHWMDEINKNNTKLSSRVIFFTKLHEQEHQFNIRDDMYKCQSR